MKHAKQILALLLTLALLLAMSGVAEEPAEEAEGIEVVEEVEAEGSGAVESQPDAVEEESGPEPEPDAAEEEPEVAESAEEIPAGEAVTEESEVAEPEEVPAEESDPMVGELAVESQSIDASSDFVIQNGELTKYKGSAAKVTIPSTVKTIKQQAFENCSGVESVIIPGNVTGIEYMAFYNMPDLTSLTFQNGTKNLKAEPQCVDCCDQLASITINRNIVRGYSWTESGGNTIPVFQSLPNLTSFKISSKVTSIPDYLLGVGSPKLETVEIANGVKSIGEYAFDGAGIQSIVIPDSVTSIGEGAFAFCHELVSAQLPSKLTALPVGIFFRCEKLNSVKLPSALKTIGLNAFYECSSLTELTIPKGVTSIDEEAFWWLEEEMPENLTLNVCAGTYAEQYCKDKGIPYNTYTSTEPDPPIGGVTVSCEEALTISAKESKTLKPSSSIKEGFKFSSSNKAVATVSTSGKITAVKAGSAVITVKGKKSKQPAECVVTVLPAPKKVVLSEEKGSCDIDGIKQITASIEPADAFQDVTWSSSNKKIAIVENGVISAIKEGKVTIVATAKHKNAKGKKPSAQFKLTVVDPTRPTNICIEQEGPVTIEVDSHILLTKVIEPLTANQEVSWSIPKKQQKYATVDEYGNVTGKKQGTVTVTVSANRKMANGKKAKASIQVRVVDPKLPTSVTLDQEGTVTLKKGETLTLRPTIEPSTAAGATLNWTSSDKSIAKVKDGVVTGLKKGTVTITVKSANGVKDTVKVKVVK